MRAPTHLDGDVITRRRESREAPARARQPAGALERLPHMPTVEVAYVNRERTHEVLAVAEPQANDRLRWTLTERPAGSADAADWLIEESVEPSSRLPDLIRDLEARLASSGEYWRVLGSEAPARVVAPKPLDLRGHAVPIPGQPDGTFLEYFHFHSSVTSRVLMALPRAVFSPSRADATKFVLASFDFPTGAPRAGALQIAHPKLMPELVVSRVAGEHITLPRKGLRKLYEKDEYLAALGPRWPEKARVVLTAAAELLFRGRLRAPDAKELAPPKAEESDVDRALKSPSYRLAREALLPDWAALLAESELAIRRAVKLARERVEHGDQARLSLVEAGLLVEYGRRVGRPRLVDEYSAQLVRMSRMFR